MFSNPCHTAEMLTRFKPIISSFKRGKCKLNVGNKRQSDQAGKWVQNEQNSNPLWKG